MNKQIKDEDSCRKEKNMIKLFIGIQARTNSTRLPGKIYLTVGGKSILKWVYDSAQEAKRVLEDQKIYEEVIVRVLGPKNDERLIKYCTDNLFSVLTPDCDENDLVSRYFMALTEVNAQYLARITSDCLFLNPGLIVEGAKALKSIDYVSNTKERTFPEGLDFQMITAKAMKWISTHQKKNREHPFFDLEKDYNFEARFGKAGFSSMSLLDLNNPSTLKTSVDTQEDFERAKRTHSTYMKKLGK